MTRGDTPGLQPARPESVIEAGSLPPRLFFVEGTDLDAVRRFSERLALTLREAGEPCSVVECPGAEGPARAQAVMDAGDSVIVGGTLWTEEPRPTGKAELSTQLRTVLNDWEPLRPARVFVAASPAQQPATRTKRALASAYRSLEPAWPDLATWIPEPSVLPGEVERSLRRSRPARRLGRAAGRSAASLAVRKSAPQPGPLLDVYWRFAAERQEIFFRRLKAEPAPWTTDPVLQTYRFTNAYRASDRVSQYLIREVIYDQERSFEDMLFRVLLFKFFNRIDTWERLKAEVGEPEWRTYRYDRYDACLSRALDEGKRIFSPAYIMPSGGPRDVLGRKHRTLLQLLEFMMVGLPSSLAKTGSMQGAYQHLLGYPMIGPFLAYQYVTDLNYGPHLNYSEMEFVMPGPGALDGLAKTFVQFGDLDPAGVIRWVTDHQEKAFEGLGLTFRTLWGRRLQLIDCQNLFCEISKYTRASHPEVLGSSGRTRIKQTFTALGEPLSVWYPPKWGLNERTGQGPDRCT